jgi:hypothetical protein
MKKVYKYKEVRKLNPGSVYKFQILKKIRFPDRKTYFVLRDPFGDKHLLPTKPYKSYQIEPGNTLFCHVDKINCQGRLFLEPLHPRYHIGNEYFFKFLRSTFLISKKYGIEQHFILKSKDGELAYLKYSPQILINHKTFENYRILKIKKARIFVEKP